MKTLADAEKYLNQFIQSRLIPGEIFLQRTKHFLLLLGNPQNKLKVIHIAGTSGKSSTAYFISQLLGDLGLKVGLQLSPHLYDIRERVQINNRFIHKSVFINYVKRLKPVIEEMKLSPHGLPSYFEIMVVMGYLLFYENNVDYAVIETGLGGITDPTNTVQSADKVAVLTKIGLDHTEILGESIDQITFNKSGIIQKGNTVFSFFQSDKIEDIYKNESAKKKRQTSDFI